MAPNLYRFRVNLRTRWRSLLAIALLAAVAGGVAMTAAAGARRTASAYDRMLDATAPADILVNPNEGDNSVIRPEQIEALPMVENAAYMQAITVVPTDVNLRAFELLIAWADPDGRSGYEIDRPNLISGRMPDPARPDEVYVDKKLADALGVDAGDRITLSVAGPEDAQPLFEMDDDEVVARIRTGEVGEQYPVTITGVGVQSDEIVVDEGFEVATLSVTPAFLERFPLDDLKVGFWGEAVRLRNPDDRSEFEAAVRNLAPDEVVLFKTLDSTAAAVRRAVRPQAVALAIFAAIIAVVGVALVVQALTRRLYAGSSEYPVLIGLGSTRREIFVVSISEVLAVVAAGTLGAVAIAVAASPLFPVGPARLAEIDPGLSVDLPVLLAGGAVMLVVVPVFMTWVAWRLAAGRARTRDARSSTIVNAAAQAGASPVVVSGMRDALERGRGRDAVPVATTLLLASGAMTAVVAVLVFAASLDHLVDTPRLFGWNWDVELEVNTTGEPEDAETQAAAAAALRDATAHALDDTPEVTAWSFLEVSSVSLAEPDGGVLAIPAVGVDPGSGEVTATIAAGRAPRQDDEIALGGRTMDRLGVGIGDHVEIPTASEPRSFRIVGQSVLPGLGNYPGEDKPTIGDGAVFTADALHEVSPAVDQLASPVVRLRGASAETVAAAVTDQVRRELAPVVGEELAGTVSFVPTETPQPADIRNYSRIRTTPLVLAAMLVLLAGAAVAHALATSVATRRGEYALLRSLGFTRRQVGGAVATHASVIAIVAAAVGIPLGIVLGRLSWRALAESLGAVAAPTVPALVVAALVPGVLIISVVVALIPARNAMRTDPATVLRAE